MKIKDSDKITDNFLLEDMDFLSKKLRKQYRKLYNPDTDKYQKKSKEIYVNWRESFDSFIRMAKPDKGFVMSHYKRDGTADTDAVKETIARLLGHYIDNFFNDEVREFCTSRVEKLCYRFGVTNVFPSKMRRDYMDYEWIDIDGSIIVDVLLKKAKNSYLDMTYLKKDRKWAHS